MRSVEYCSSSAGAREYGSREYALASNWGGGSSQSSTDDRTSSADERSRREGGSDGNQHSASHVGQTFGHFTPSPGAGSGPGQSQRSASVTEVVDSKRLQQLSQTTQALVQSTPLFVQSAQLKQSAVTSLKEEREKLSHLLSSDWDRVKAAIEKKVAEKKQMQQASLAKQVSPANSVSASQVTGVVLDAIASTLVPGYKNVQEAEKLRQLSHDPKRMATTEEQLELVTPMLVGINH